MALYQKSYHQSKRRGSETLLFKNSVTLEPTPYLHPYMDSASWLYLDPSPSLQMTTPVMHPHDLEYAMPPPRRKIKCCERHRHHRSHRRVVSDPGFRNWEVSAPSDAKKHRRISSFNQEADICVEEAMNCRNQDCFFNEDARTSTFRKVPWHPNLHMLKIRRT